VYATLGSFQRDLQIEYYHHTSIPVLYALLQIVCKLETILNVAQVLWCAIISSLLHNISV